MPLTKETPSIQLIMIDSIIYSIPSTYQAFITVAESVSIQETKYPSLNTNFLKEMSSVAKLDAILHMAMEM